MLFSLFSEVSKSGKKGARPGRLIPGIVWGLYFKSPYFLLFGSESLGALNVSNFYLNADVVSVVLFMW